MIRVTKKFYVCNYADYQGLPSKLYDCHDGDITESIDNTKFVVSGTGRTDTSLSWMMGTEPEFNHDGIVSVIKGVDWDLDA